MTRHDHTDWCAQGHLCGLGEHRAHPLTFTIPGAGSVVLTRVRGRRGTQFAEIRISVTLPTDEPAARARLTSLMTHLRTLIGAGRLAHRPHRTVT